MTKHRSYDFFLPLPPTLNQTYKVGNGKFYKSGLVKDWEKEITQLLKFVYKIKEPLLGNLYVGIMMYLKYDRDIDSSTKVLLDTMAKAGVYENDRQIVFLNIQKFINNKFPKISKTSYGLYINVIQYIV